MKSLEILNELREMNKTKDKKSYYDVIESDLKVLYLLKKTLSIFKDKNKDGEINFIELVGSYSSIYDKEDFKRIKEWLENDE